MNERGSRARAELEPSWDDVREARVLSRILAESERAEAPGGRIPRFAAALVVAAAAAGFAIWQWRDTGAEQPRAAVAEAPVLAAPGGSVLSLADGSKALLGPGAEVAPLEQGPQQVRLAQGRGQVRYEVKPNPGRAFVVQARDVEVRVIGTIFTLDVEADAVRVSVERGRVAVQSGERHLELGVGETIRLSTVQGAARPDASVRGSDGEARALPGSAVDDDGPARQAERPQPAGPTASPERLLAEADAARGRGDLGAAERRLSQLLAEHPSSAQASSAAFSLGRIQSARGNFGAAARTFQNLRQRAPTGPLAEDALAEAANASALAGQAAVARTLAEQYLRQYPAGAHAGRMRRLGQP